MTAGHPYANFVARNSADAEQNQWGVLKNRLTDVAITLGGPLVASANQALSAGSPLLDWADSAATTFQSLPQGLQTTAIATAAMAAAMGPAVYVAGTLAGSAGTLIKAWQGVRTAMVGVEVFSAVSGGMTALGTSLGVVTVSAEGATLAVTGLGLALGAIVAIPAFIMITNKLGEMALASGEARASAEAQLKTLGHSGWSDHAKQLEGVADKAKALAANEGELADGFKVSIGAFGGGTKAAAEAGAAHESLGDKVKALTQAQRDDILAKRDDGEATKAISEETNIAKDVIAAFLKQHDASTAQAKKHADALDSVQRALQGETKDRAVTIQAIQNTIKAGIEDAATTGRVVDAIEKLRAAHAKLPPDLLAWAGANRTLSGTHDTLAMGIGQLNQRVPDLSQHVAEATAMFKENAQWVAPLTAKFYEFAGGLSVAGDTLGRTIIPAFSTLPNVAAGAGKAIASAMGEAQTSTTAWRDDILIAERSLSRIGGFNLGPLLGQMRQTFMATGVGQKAAAFLDSRAITSSGGKLAMTGVSAGIGILEQATEDPETKAGQVANSAAKGAQIGTMIMPGWGTAIGAGVGAVVGALKVSPEEIAARTSLEGFMKQFGTLEQTIQAVGATYAAYGKTGVQAERDLKAALDASHVSVKAEEAALKTINDVMDAQEQRTVDLAAGIDEIGPAFNSVVAGTAVAVKGWDALKKAVDDARESQVLATQKGDSNAAVRSAMDLVKATRAQASAADGAKQELADLGVQAVASFATAVAGGSSVADALKAISPGLDTIKQSYTDLGLDVEDVALKNLMMQNSIVEGNPALLGAIGGLSSEMEALDKIGGLNIDTFGSMERTGMQMYGRLQSQVAAVGGTTKDALVPMQGFLRDAMTEAMNLGVPLDANTKMLIDQSKELGIWKDTGKSSAEILDLSMKAVVDRIGELIDKLSGPGGVTDAIGKIPRRVDVDVQARYTGPGAPTPPDGFGADGVATGGLVTARGIEHFASGGFVGGPRGTDTVPAWLTPGEAVLNKGQQNAVLALMRGGGDPGGMKGLHAEVAGLREDLKRSDQRFERMFNTMPIMMKHALRGLV